MDAETEEKARVLAAADALFYTHGIQAVGMDRIRDAAGVSLKRLYSCFPSKAALVEAYLRGRDEWARGELAAHVAGYATPRERILGVFEWLYAWFAGDDFHGCAFLNAYGELASGSEGVVHAVRDHKSAVREYLRDLAREAGTPDPETLGDQLTLLLDGAMSNASVTDSAAPALHARDAAATLLAASSGGSRAPA